MDPSLFYNPPSLSKTACLSILKGDLIYTAGLDLAGKPENPSGFTIIKGNEFILHELIYSDNNILERLNSFQFQIIAVDAPLTIPPDLIRECDNKMKRYGAMPLKLKSMEELGIRAISLIEYFSHPPEIIEVFPTGTSKILKI